MNADAWFEADLGEPLGLWTQPPVANGGVRAVRFAYASRGDRVPGRLWLPDATAAAPLVLLQHGLGGSKDADYLDSAARPWVAGGAAVLSVDFPLHGERADAKLSQQLLAGMAPDASDAAHARRALLTEFGRQAVVDLRRALDAAEHLPGVDATRVAYAGFSLGALVGATFCALDPRPRAAALALAGGGLAPEEVDPLRYVGRIAPRPLLFVNAGSDERIPRSASEALYAAAREPKQMLWFDGATHQQLPGAALNAMWQFLRAQLGLDSLAPDGGTPAWA